MQILALHRYARSSAQKTRLVANLIRHKAVKQALEILQFSRKKPAKIIKKVLLSAVANAEHNEGISIEKLKVAFVLVDKAASMKRIMPRAKGRGDSILKNTTHIKIILSSL